MIITAQIKGQINRFFALIVQKPSFIGIHSKYSFLSRTHAAYSFNQIRRFAKGAGGKEPPGESGKTEKEKVDPIQMPGFVHPENKYEEGYFTAKARIQLQELKRKIDLGVFPEKKK